MVPSPTKIRCGRWGTVPLGKLILMANMEPSWQGSLRREGRNGRWSRRGESEGGRVEGRLAHFFGWRERAQPGGCPLLLPASLLRPVNMCVKKT